MGITVCKILRCCAEEHDAAKPREFEYIYETGVDPEHTYMCAACRERVYKRAAAFTEARTGELPQDMDRTAEGRPLENHGLVPAKRPWQTVPKQIGGDGPPPDIDGAVTRRWGEEEDIRVVNEGRA